jgi:hypothetical protein
LTTRGEPCVEGHGGPIGSTEAFADTCGAAILALFYRKPLPSTAGWFHLAGQPFRSGGEAQSSFRSRYTVVTLGP